MTGIKALRRLCAAMLPALLLALLLTGCNPGGSERPSGNGDEGAAPPGDTVNILLYFAEAKAINSGAPEEYGFVAPVSRAVPAGEDLVAAALAELIRGPQPADEGYFGTLPSTAKILSVQAEDTVLYVDFSHELISDSPGGTLGGTVFMQSMVFTLTQFPGIDKVQALVEGDPWCDGHFIWDEPLGPEDMVERGDS